MIKPLILKYMNTEIIITNKKKDDESISDYIRKLYIPQFPETYIMDEKGEMHRQCQAGKNRSVRDLFYICLTQIEGLTFEEFLKELAIIVKDEKLLVLIICDAIQEVVLFSISGFSYWKNAKEGSRGVFLPYYYDYYDIIKFNKYPPVLKLDYEFNFYRIMSLILDCSIEVIQEKVELVRKVNFIDNTTDIITEKEEVIQEKVELVRVDVTKRENTNSGSFVSIQSVTTSY